MTWSADLAVQVQNLVTQIATRLTAAGWTDYDPGQNVYTSINDQGVTQYVQITNVGAYQYIQLQGFLSWNAVTHAGTSGSGTSNNRIYYSAAAVGATTPVDLYMSVTANRIIIFIDGTVNYRHWGLFGGLDSLAGASDPHCVVIGSSYVYAIYVLQSSSGGGAYWIQCSYNSIQILGSGSNAALGPLGSDMTQMLAYPILISEFATPYYVRGNLDGVLYVPLQMGVAAHLDTLSISGVTYLLIQPGPAANQAPALTGTYLGLLALAEV